jgi:phosphatidylserine decarboxylase
LSRSGPKKFPVAREGFKFILPLAVVSLIFWVAGFVAAAVFFILLTLFVLYFFRDPERVPPPGDKAILSPADGTVVQIQPCVEPNLLKGPAIKVSVFMSLFDVHVNRNPMTGRIVESAYTEGEFIRADREQASFSNEQNALLVENPEGVRLVLVQVAGVIARRIVCRVKKGDRVEKGQRFGLIQFGSRLDLYLPPKTGVQVRLRQKTAAGQTIIGTLP